MNDLVSIIIPIYNAEKFIDETISTVLDQTHRNFELILVNDCSTDNTSKLLEKYLKDVIILGPSPSGIFRVNNIFRYQIILKYKNENDLYPVLEKMVEHYFL